MFLIPLLSTEIKFKLLDLIILIPQIFLFLVFGPIFTFSRFVNMTLLTGHISHYFVQDKAQ